jgi:hypothetical protein
MIKISNKKLGRSILIDDSVDWVVFTPKDYDDPPHVVIEFKNFNYLIHATHCQDCKEFIESFSKDSRDWYLSWGNKVFSLRTDDLGQKGYGENQIKHTVSDYDDSSKLTLVFHDLPNDNDQLKARLQAVLQEEDYETACLIRDLMDVKISNQE